MIVYVVEEHYEYEGFTIEGIFASREQAETKRDSLRDDEHDNHWSEVSEHEVIE